MVTTAPVKPRWRKTLRSTIGCSSVSSQIRKAAKPIAATSASATMIGEPNQSSSLPLSSMICSAPTKTTSRPRPTKSTGAARSGSRAMRSMRQAKKPQTAATGTLM